MYAFFGLGALPQDENDSALDVAALLQLGVGLGGDVPGRRHLKTRCPEDAGHVAPDLRVLVREHDDLQAVVGHVVGEGV